MAYKQEMWDEAKKNAVSGMKRSEWQKEWGNNLISQLHLSGAEMVLDLGCGDGVLSELREDILSALHRADISFYEDSMRPLVYKDIQKALKEIQKL